MDYAKLRKHLIALASLPKTEAPVISAYFDLGRPVDELRSEFRAWSALTAHTFVQDSVRKDFEDAAEEIDGWLRETSGNGAAAFCRWGEQPLFLPMSFEAPLPTRLHVDELPVIYPLVELKDRFNRFVVVLTTESVARIVEVNLGAVSVELLSEKPALRDRIGPRWTREHYVNHRHHRDERFVKEKIAVIEGLMSKRGHNALILAGDEKHVARMSAALPLHLRNKIIDKIRIEDDRISEVMKQAVDAFLRAESQEAHDVVERLVQAVRSRGLAAVGYEATREALLEDRAEQLVLSNLLPQDQQEEMIRLASRHNVPIETVQDCSLLDLNGGVGCLLRYLHGDFIVGL
jgi:ribosomal protein L30E